jgi:hypothetical protein
MSIKNVFIFVADALREDYLPSKICDIGDEIQTIAASTNTPSSFSSMVSGLYPTQHGTYSFSHRLDPAYNFFNRIDDEYDTRFYQHGNTAAIADVLGVDFSETNPLDDVEPPFAVLERELNTHAPYNQFHDEDGEYDQIGDYFENGVIDFDLVKREYQSGCERVERRFLERLDQLKSRGVLDETLVIFTSDHGEFLGEYGEHSHGDPVVPELIRVPTVIKHPEDQPLAADLMGHIDILPTIEECLDIDVPWNHAGESVYSQSNPHKISEFVSKPHILDEFSLQDYYEYKVRSVWDKNGSRHFNSTTIRGRSIHAIRQAPLFNPLRGRDALRSFKALYHHLATERVTGNPEFSKAEAEEILQVIDEMNIKLSSSREEVSDSTKEHLERLGYMN